MCNVLHFLWRLTWRSWNLYLFIYFLIFSVVALKRYNYGDLVYYALNERNKFFKMTEKRTPKVEEGM